MAARASRDMPFYMTQIICDEYGRVYGAAKYVATWPAAAQPVTDPTHVQAER